MLILPKAHLTSHSKISGCRGVITPSWLSGSLRPFLYSSVCIWLWDWAIHSCCSSHLWHFWKGVPVIHQCRELEAPCCNDLDSMRGPVFSLDSLSCIIPAFSAVNAGALPGVLLLKPEHPAPTRNSGHECKPLLSWEVLFGNELCGEFSRFAFWAPVPLFPSEVPKLPLVLTYEEISECPGTFPPSQFPPQSAGPHPKIFFFFFNLYLLPYLILRRLAFLFGCQGSSASIQNVFCMSWSTCRCIFHVFMGRRLISPSYSSSILKVPPPLSY